MLADGTQLTPDQEREAEQQIADVLQCISMDAGLLRYPAEPWRESPRRSNSGTSGPWGSSWTPWGSRGRLSDCPGDFTVVL